IPSGTQVKAVSRWRTCVLRVGPPENRFVHYAPHILISVNFAARVQKLAQLTHFNVIANVVQAATFENLSKQGRKETALGILPLSHSYGLVLGHLLVWRGDCIVLHPRFDMQVPSIIAALAANPFLFDIYDVSSVKAVVTGSASFGPRMAEALKKVRPTWQILPGYAPIQPSAEGDTNLQIPGMEIVPVPSDEFDSYGLNIECTLGSTTVKVDVRFDENMVTTIQVERLLAQFAHVTQQLCDPTGLVRLVGDIDLVCPQDLQQISEWNKTVPPAVESCVHDEIAAMVKQQPSALAICSWDGSFTYQELSTQAATLAYYLVELGVGPETMVSFCMDKSKWAVVAMLAILQAGGVVIPLGTGYPLKRTEGIVQDADSNIILVDQSQADFLAALVDTPLHLRLIVVDPALIDSLPAKTESPAVM
ncbi:MAG: hypothetical protein Q9180_007049, partial [Flavoplaca navasiana]